MATLSGGQTIRRLQSALYAAFRPPLAAFAPKQQKKWLAEQRAPNVFVVVAESRCVFVVE